ncbi:MAG: FecR domain-containing protein [Deltaproteobacteria bacterium]|nr:FecR domain-containing protein [Deltaproteobacteria bacterium]
MTHHRLIILVFSLLLSTLFIGKPVQAGEINVGQIREVKQPVTVVRGDGQKVTAEEKLPLFAGDQIVTGKAGSVRFTIENGGEFRLGEESQASVDELSSRDADENPPKLRLVLGYLWSKIMKIKGGKAALEIYTPTAVAGIRGTEFETVVSLDAGTVVTVDEGSVEVSNDEASIRVDQGKMTEVELDGKPSTPVAAIPKDQRDWKAWRKKRIRRLFQNLPQTAPRFEKRFKRATFRSKRFTDKVNRQANDIRENIQKLRDAKQSRNRQAFFRVREQLRQQVPRFREMVGQFRKGLNRVRTMGRLSHRVEKFVADNKDRFSAQDLTTIESSLNVISLKRMQLRSIYRRTIQNIRQTFRELRELRQEFRRTGGTA